MTTSLGSPVPVAPARPLLVELVGSTLLVAATSAASLSAAMGRGVPGTSGLAGALTSAGVLAALVLAVPGGRFHPLLTLLDLATGRVSGRGAAARIALQLLGGLLGGVAGLWLVLGRAAGVPSLQLNGLDGPNLLELALHGVLGGLLLGLVVAGVLVRGVQLRETVGVVAGLATIGIGLGVDGAGYANPALALARAVTAGPFYGLPLVWSVVLLLGHAVGAAVGLFLARTVVVTRD